MAWITPIYDRTQTDIDNLEDKAYADYDFYNRVEKNNDYLADEATTLGYPISITAKFDWVNADEYDEDDVDRILWNLQELLDNVPTLTSPTVPTDLEDFTYDDLNDMEEIEYNAYNILNGIQADYLYASFSGGTNRTRQYLQRG